MVDDQGIDKRDMILHIVHCFRVALLSTPQSNIYPIYTLEPPQSRHFVVDNSVFVIDN